MAETKTINLKPTEKQYEAWQLLQDKKTKFLIFGGGAGGGKLVVDDGNILTPFGWKKGKDLKLGDALCHPSGQHQNIIQIKQQEVLPSWTVTFHDGSKTIVAEEHLWQAWKSGKQTKWKNKLLCGEESAKVITTKTLKEWLDNSIDQVNRGIRPNWPCIPVCKEQHFNVSSRNKIDIEPYLLGILLGDGHLGRTVGITSVDSEHMHKVLDGLNLDYKYDGEKQYCLRGVKHLKNELERFGLRHKRSWEKFVPRDYLWGSIDERWAVIQGLMDTDGYASHKALYYTTTSKELADNFKHIVGSLGGTATVTSKIPTYHLNGVKKSGRLAYTLYIKHREPQKFFRLKRKKDIASLHRISPMYKRVVKIEIGEPINGRCITVSKPDGLYITDDFIVTHNSWLGCEWLLTQCYQYKGSKWFIGREELTRLKSSTYITWTKVCKYHGIPTTDWKLNSQNNYIEFINPNSASFGSRVDLLDVSFKPSDPLYERFGSTEYTGGFLEEAGEISFKAFDVLKSRVGRHMNKEFGLMPKIYITCNPKKNWLYSKIYKRWKDGTLPEQYAFIQSLYNDNPYTAEDYGEQLSEIDDKVTIQRLKYGNWEYDDDPAKMIEYDAICDLFHMQLEQEKPRKYMTIDVARLGVDKAVIYVWYGMAVKEIYVYPKCTIDQLQEYARDISNKHGIPRSQTIADQDGVGGGFTDNFKCKGFVNNATPIQKELPPGDEKKLKQVNYENIKGQCADLMARKINNHEVSICKTEWEEDIKEELEVLKRIDLDKEGKFKIIKKDAVKELIGRSPDFLDTMIMRGYFELKPKKERKIASGLTQKVRVNFITGRAHR